MKQKKSKSKIKQKSVFSNKKASCNAEHRIIVPVESENIFDPCFPKKKKPAHQVHIDIQLLHKTENFKEFVEKLEDILPFWIKHKRFYLVDRYNLADYIHKKGRELRAEDTTGVPPIPKTLEDVQDWITDVKRCLIKGRRGQPPNKKAIKSIDNLIKLLKDEANFSKMPKKPKSKSWEWIVDKIGYPKNPENKTPRFKIMQQYLRTNNLKLYNQLKSILEKNSK